MARIRQNGGFVGKINNTTTSGASGIFGPNELQYRRLDGLWPNVTATAAAQISDEYFEYTTLLLPGNGTNGAQNNTFLDGSTNNFTITRNGNTTQGTFSPFSQTGWGNYFDGTGDYLTVPNNTALNFGTGDFTIEAWVSIPSTPATDARVYSYQVSSSTVIKFAIDSSRKLAVFLRGNGGTLPTVYTSTNAISVGSWTHIALTRSGTTGRIFVNGNLEETQTGQSQDLTASVPAYIGTFDGSSDNFTGYISNLRVVKGVAVYTGTFTPPTSPLAATQSAGTNISAITGTQTSLLTCQSNRFIDNSTNNFTITVNGNTSVVAFSPFNPTASWSAATNGGSGYFDGTGDYLQLPITALTGQFTIEFWFYRAVTGNNYTFTIGDSLNATGIQIYIGTNGTILNYYTGQAARITATPPDVGSWSYIAATRDSSNVVRLYVNGTQVGGTYTHAATLDTTLRVGAEYYTGAVSGSTNGYISNFRISNIVRTITLPTQPLVNDANTLCLLNFTNAGIYDATSKNDLETVGNAQISTTQSKWGGSSMSFDGTGDSLITPASIVNSIGTGDFTIEFWCYPSNTTAAYRAIVASENYNSTAGGWSIYQNGTGIEIYLTGGALITAASQLVASTWQHIALVRSGSASNNCKLYVNGTNVASATNTADWTGQRIFIGDNNYPGTDYFFNGYIQDLRITRGIARYTANFTAPTAAFPTL